MEKNPVELNSIPTKKSDFKITWPFVVLIVFGLGIVASLLVLLAPFATIYFLLRLFFSPKKEIKKQLEPIKPKSKKLTMVEFLNSNLSVVRN